MRKKSVSKHETFSAVDIFIIILIAPLFLLKWLGNLFFIIIKLIIHQIKQTYNILSSLLKKSSNKITKLFIAFSIKKIINKRKKTIFIYQSKKKKKLNFIKHIYVSIISTIQNKLSLPYSYRKQEFISTLKLLFIKIKFFVLGTLVVIFLISIWQINSFMLTLPNPAYLSNRDLAATTKIFDRNGKFLYEIYADQNRIPVALSDIPDYVKEATIAIEDKEFYQHPGFSPRGIIRSLIHNLNYSSLEGGSTITQQLIRSALLTPDKTLVRKLKEIFLAIWAEQIYSKDQILEMYLNQVPYGGTAWGIEAAAQTYFGKSIKDVDLAQGTLLAGLPAAPSIYSPFGSYPKLSKYRQQEVLKNMVDQGFIDKSQAQKAINTPLRFQTPRIAISAPHFVMYVKELLEKQYGPKLVETGGLRVYTTLDLSIQEMTQDIVKRHLDSLSNLNVRNGAVVITNPQNGEILAMVGSKDYFDSEYDGNVNVTLSLRQPGSSIKVVTYAAALTNGFTAASLLNDSPVSYNYSNQSSYRPVNYDGRYHGIVPLRVALASSYNIPAIRVLEKIGLAKMIDQAKLMGITTFNDSKRFGLSLTLGGGEVTMLDMAKVYGTLGNGGIKNELTPFLKITNYKGEIIPLTGLSKETRATTPEIAYILSDILSDNTARAPAFGLKSALYIPNKTVAVKTGTSDNKRDNWTIGYTNDYVVTVWVGNNDNSPMHPNLTSGITGAAPIWHDIITQLLQDKPDKPFIPPFGIISIPCFGRKEYFTLETKPAKGCPTLKPLSPTPTIN